MKFIRNLHVPALPNPSPTAFRFEDHNTMKQHYTTPEEFAVDVAKFAKNAWVNGTFDVNGTIVEIKAYGKWVQRINANCLTGGGEFKTQKAMREFIVSHVGHN